jgi:hypothetical protein
VGVPLRKEVAKLRKRYREKEGWTTRDLVAGYKLLEDTTKAEIFWGMDRGEDQDEWLRIELTTYL